MLGALAAQAQVGPLKTSALSFGFNGLNLSSPYGSRVGGKLWISENRALAAGLSGNWSHSTYKTPDTTYDDDETRSYGLGVRAGLEQHLDMGWGVSPYMVAGASIGVNGYRYSTISVYDTSSYKDRSVSLGLFGGAGLEWWFARRLSLTGQQLLVADLRFGKSRQEGLAEVGSRSVSLNVGTSSLMLNVYL